VVLVLIIQQAVMAEIMLTVLMERLEQQTQAMAEVALKMARLHKQAALAVQA
jgi:hypothetical protein